MHMVFNTQDYDHFSDLHALIAPSSAREAKEESEGGEAIEAGVENTIVSLST